MALSYTIGSIDGELCDISGRYGVDRPDHHWEGISLTAGNLVGAEKALKNISNNIYESLTSLCSALDVLNQDDLIKYDGTQDFLEGTFQELVNEIADYGNKVNTWLVSCSYKIGDAFTRYQNQNRYYCQTEERLEKVPTGYDPKTMQTLYTEQWVQYHIIKSYGGGATGAEYKAAMCPYRR